MKLTNPPIALPIPFASAASPGTLNVIPIPSQVGITAGAASYETGFPTTTFLDPADGGVAPLGADFNGVLNAITQSITWVQAGGSFQYNATFSADIFGYPLGAILQRSDATGGWINTIDQNTSNPNAGGAGWLPYGGSTSPLQLAVAGSNITLTALQAASNSITLTGTLTANISIILPNWAGGRWLVINKATMGIFNITFTTAGGAGVEVNSGESSLYGDGTDIILTGNPGIPDAPADGNIYGRKNNAWVVAVAGSPLINPMTNPGDTIYGGVAGTPEALVAGSNGQVYRLVSGLPAWTAETTSLNRPAASVSSVGGVVTIDLSQPTEIYLLTLSENVTSWVFSNPPTAGFMAEIEIEVTQSASTAYTCVSPASTGKTSAGPWTVSATLGAAETLGARIDHTGVVTLYPAGPQS